MTNFIYNIPVRVYFGENQIANLGKELLRYGKRVLMVYGGGSIKKSGLYDIVRNEIIKAGLLLYELSGIQPNPRVQSVRDGVKICKDEHVDVLLAVGGGSVIDATKFIAAGALVDFDPWDFLSKQAPLNDALPIVTLLTIAATGSEMNAGAVISNPDTKDKIGRVSSPLYPKASFLDPTITYTVGAYQTACGAADMMSHIVETYFDREKDLFMLDCFMEGMLKTIIKYAPVAINEPDNYVARANLMWTGSWAINSFIDGAKLQKWSCHPIEHEISALYDIAHGQGMAILMPRWLNYCLDNDTAYKYYQFGVNVFGIDKSLDEMTVAKESVEKLSHFLFNTLKLKSSLKEVGIDDCNFTKMAQKACKGNTLNGFKKLKQDDIIKILQMCN